MKSEVQEHRKNPLLKREEAWVLVEHPGKATPKREEIVKDAAKALKAKEDLVIVDKIFSFTGRMASRARVFVYSKKEDIPKEKLEKIARRTKRKEAKPEEAAEAPKPEEKKEEAKPEEKPKEEKKEEKPAEEKKEEKE